MKLFVVLLFAVFGMAWAQTDMLSNFALNLQIPTNSGSPQGAQQNTPNSGSFPGAEQNPSNFALGLQIPTKNSSSNFGFDLQIPINPAASSQQQQFPPNSGSHPQSQQYPPNPQAPQLPHFAPYTPVTTPPPPPPQKKNYFINRKDRLNWLEAKEHCKLNGMQLATIDTREKYDHLRMQLEALNIADALWAYGTSTGRRAFYWPETNQDFDFADWGPNQPTRFGSGQECLNFRKLAGHYRFDDFVCAIRQGFICEYM